MMKPHSTTRLPLRATVLVLLLSLGSLPRTGRADTSPARTGPDHQTPAVNAAPPNQDGGGTQVWVSDDATDHGHRRRGAPGVPLPEPATWAEIGSLLALGGGLVVLAERRKRKAA